MKNFNNKDQELYEQRVTEVLRVIKYITREQVKSNAWLPFCLLYESMIYRGEIKTLSDLPEEKRRQYWDETEGIRFVTNEKFKRVVLCQALYLFDLLTTNNKNYHGKN